MLPRAGVTPVWWIFGYGSLVWRPAFPFAERRVACLEGWSRRFWQGSTDHRGVPGAPGRVVTLIEEAASRCWGLAYRVGDSARDGVLEQLDLREQGGYERREVTLRLADPRTRREPGDSAAALVYLATPSNPNYLGPAPIDAIASQVLAARGPSGSNLDYVARLAEALRDLGVDRQEDEHVFELERLVAAATKRSSAAT
ncbi:MAG TPA: gamma-glutamylcyclotransferase [Thermoanaerobaculia bacterium]|nr:gamma-glutamylcyclotransferase [Thermoanaerobaculia bacterium]